jgi:hypothetical protein
MKKLGVLLLIAALHAVTCAKAPSPSRTLMAFLTSPEIGGREAGTPEARRVADTLAALMARTGLKPVAGGGYFQPFPAETPQLDSTRTCARFYPQGETDSSRAWEATLSSGLFFFPRHGQTQTIMGPVLTGGYGVVAPELGRKDYEPEAARGKVLMLFIGAPRDTAFQHGGTGFRHTVTAVKARTAQESGALAVVFVQADGDSGRLRREVQARSRNLEPRLLQIPGTQAFPILYLDIAPGDRLQRDQAGDSDGLVANLTIAFTFDEPCSLRNVVGIIPGSDPDLAQECIVVGAHYDHLGRRGDLYYPGADDNASGVVALIAVAQAVVADPPARSVLFALFDGEEKGLLGSKWLVEHPLGEGDVVAMINLDGVGRRPSGHIPEGSPLKIDDSELTVFYSSQSPWIEGELSRVAEVQSLDVTFDPCPVFHEFSDHASFHAKGIPTMFCFSGVHGDYNAPTDTPEKIEWDLLNRRADFVAGCVETLGNRKEPFSFYGGAGEERP